MADRAGILFDACAYYRALRGALLRARHSVMIIGWDIDSRLPLVRGEDTDDAPVTLAAVLGSIARARPALEVRVLVWDYSPIFLLERESLSWLRLGRRTHPRVHFAFDDAHPPGGSQHEKVVVIDDRVAFCGGIDLCDVRWDRPDHRPHDPLRVDVRGQAYRPHHDMHMVVDAEAAAALGRLARARWAAATGEEVGATRGTEDPWPPEAPIDFVDVEIGIARTRPAPVPDGVPPQGSSVREVERLWLDMIAAAERLIYIETPYLSLNRVTRALCERLRSTGGPEVVLVSSPTCNGWLQNVTMGLLRDQVVAELRAADREGRFAALARVEPLVGGGDMPVNVHAKLCIVDDRILRVGSANLTNRSMGLDRECDLAIEARTPLVATAIRDVQQRLIAEHTHSRPRTVAETAKRLGSMRRAVLELAGRSRSLRPLPHRPPRIVPRAELVDPGDALTLSQIRRVLLPNVRERELDR